MQVVFLKQKISNCRQKFQSVFRNVLSIVQDFKHLCKTFTQYTIFTDMNLKENVLLMIF